MLPRVAPALAASARGLFTTKRAAYLGTAGADIDVDYSAIRSVRADPLRDEWNLIS